MNRIWAIAVITMRNAVRSRVVLCLLGVLLLIVLGLPLTIRGDGTAASMVAIHLRYTLGFSVLLLSIVTVWAGCAAISTEIQDRQMHLVITKPVRSHHIWMGKWVGLMTLNLLFVLFVALCTYGMLHWTTRPAVLDAEERRELHDEILAAHRHLSPMDEALRDAARRQFAELVARDEVPEEIPAREVLHILERQIRHQAYSVPQGESRLWVFHVPRKPPENHAVYLQYRFSSSRLDLLPVPGRWRAAPAAGNGIMVEHVEATPRLTYTLPIPPELIDADGHLMVEYRNESPSPVTVIFSPEDGLHLLVYEQPFEVNYVRALLVILTQLAFLSAVGITAGTLFSFPVAALAAFYVVLLLNAGRIISAMAARDVYFARPDTERPGLLFIDAALRMFYRGLDYVLQPLDTLNPLEHLSEGRLIPLQDIGWTALIGVLFYGGVMALLGAWHLRQREIGLPTE